MAIPYSFQLLSGVTRTQSFALVVFIGVRHLIELMLL